MDNPIAITETLEDVDLSGAGAILLSDWFSNPVSFLTDVLDVREEYLWPRMIEVCNSLRDHRMVAVKAGHGVSKSFTAARLALWFLYTHVPSTVITTAPSNDQVEEVLWREIRTAHGNAKMNLGGKLTLTELDLQSSDQPERWFAVGFATRPDIVTQQATRFQGFHNEYVLVIFDEAAGILPQIWQAAHSLINTDKCRWLCIGNPTSSFGEFVDCFQEDSEWHRITISVLDSPNYQQKTEIIPGVSGVDYERSVFRKYGKDSNYYRSRVLGEFPEYVEGTIYGKAMRQAKLEGRITSVPWDSTALVHTAWDLGIGDATAIWWFQEIRGGEIHILDYYEASGEPISHYIGICKEKSVERGFQYGSHYAPFDANNKSLQTGSTLVQTAMGLGLMFQVLPVMSLLDGIEVSRQQFNRCWFDKERCKIGLQALAEYRWRLNLRMSTDERPVFTTTPEHDWCSHGADAFRYLSQACRIGNSMSRITSQQIEAYKNFYRRPAG